MRSRVIVRLAASLTYALLFTTTAVLYAQTAVPADPGAGGQRLENRITTLTSILKSMSVIQNQIEARERTYLYARTEERRAQISTELQSLNRRLEDLRSDFMIIAAGIDPRSFFDGGGGEVIWEQELKEIFTPIILELKEVTAHPRQVERLRRDLAEYQRKMPQIQMAKSNLGQLAALTTDEALHERLQSMAEFWAQQEQEYQSQLDAIRLQLREKERERKSVGEAAQDIIRVFFKSRGRNLFLALFCFAAVFLLLRYFHRQIHKLGVIHRLRKHQFIIRVADVIYYLFTVVAAIGALLIVLYLSADWVLLGLAIIFLVGLAWTAKYALPAFLEQAKLLLNLGPVREGERLVYNGIPWRVNALNLDTDLVNPDLQGGVLRIPLNDLSRFRSRAPDQSEPWFPTAAGDWVVLSGTVYGKVVFQSPEQVTIDTLRGSLQTYTTADFLDQHPRNLSRTEFSIENTVSLDYRYRGELNREVSPRLRVMLEEEFRKEPYGALLVEIVAELKEMGNSSLDIITIVKFRGEAARWYREIGWRLQQISLDACNRYDWEIPFPQLTIHQKGAGGTV